MEYRRGLAIIILFVRPSVKRVSCDKTERKIVFRFLYRTKDHISLVFRERMIGGGCLLVPEILSQTDRVERKSPIFDLFSPVALQP